MDSEPGKFTSVDDLVGAEFPQIVPFLLGPPGRGDNAIAEPVKKRDRKRTHPTGGTGHQHISFGWRDSLLFQGQHAKHGREAGGADRHGLGRRNILREPDKPVALDARSLGVTTVVQLAEAVAIQHDAIAYFKPRVLRAQHPTGQVDTWNERELADDRDLARYREAILVVHRRVLDRHVDIPVHEICIGQLGNHGALPVAIFGYKQGPELLGHVSLSIRVANSELASIPQ